MAQFSNSIHGIKLNLLKLQSNISLGTLNSVKNLLFERKICALLAVIWAKTLEKNNILILLKEREKDSYQMKIQIEQSTHMILNYIENSTIQVEAVR